MGYTDYESWVAGLSKEELEEAYMAGGSRDDVGLMRAYWAKVKQEEENKGNNEPDE